MISFESLQNKQSSIAVVGLGYVGLPLSIALAQHFNVIAFDIDSKRIDALKNGFDSTREIDTVDLQNSEVSFTCIAKDLQQASVIIVAVPTPIDKHKRPNLSHMYEASITIGNNMSKGCVVVYESTVYPGVTEDECVPILEKESGLKYLRDFTVGYSPERLNPGDKVHRLENTVKIVAGSDAHTTSLLEKLYGSIVKVGIHTAPTIKVAEAAKIIENTQRDVNIAFMNELALIFNIMGIDTLDVLEAAGTKWNFLPFRPGLVGGHCIGVDPYYLTHKAEEIGYHPELIHAGHRINARMSKFVAETCIKRLIKNNVQVKNARIAIFGLTFKENVPDIRNSRVIDIIHELKEYDTIPLVHDPEAHADEVMEKHGIELLPLNSIHNIDALILAIPHTAFAHIGVEAIQTFFGSKPVIVLDVKGYFDKNLLREAGFDLWQL